MLKRPVAQKYAAAFCGRGKLAACRKALESSLKSALGEKATDTYPADAPARRATSRAWTPCASAPWAASPSP